MIALYILLDCKKVNGILVNIGVILIAKIILLIFLYKLKEILFYKYNLSISLIIVSDINNLKLGNILFFVKFQSMLY